MAYKRLQVISFFLVLLVVFIVVLFIVRPFAELLAFGVILAILLQPIYTRFLKALKSDNLAALFTVLLVIVIVLIPIVFFGQIVVNDAIGLYARFKAGDFILRQDQLVTSLPATLRGLIENLSRSLNDFISNLTSHTFQSLSGLVSNVAVIIVSLISFLLTVFYLLRDGSKIKEFFQDLSPIAARQENELIEKVVVAVNGVVKGSFLTALIHGIFATIGFFIFGVPEPLVWGSFTVIAALVPVVGVWISLVPAVLYLLVTGHVGAGIGMAIWAVVAVLFTDNVLAPQIVGRRARLHPLLVLLGVLGGLSLFGPLGFLLGPIVMAIFVTLVDIYRHDFKDYVEQ